MQDYLVTLYFTYYHARAYVLGPCTRLSMQRTESFSKSVKMIFYFYKKYSIYHFYALTTLLKLRSGLT